MRMTITLNGEDRLVPPGLTVADLVRHLGLPDRGIAVAVDRVVVPRGAWARSTVPVGSQVDVVEPMQGG
jgi:sulfur carrier protein